MKIIRTSISLFFIFLVLNLVIESSYSTDIMMLRKRKTKQDEFEGSSSGLSSSQKSESSSSNLSSSQKSEGSSSNSGSEGNSSSSSSYSSSSSSYSTTTTSIPVKPPAIPGSQEHYWNTFFVADRGDKCAGEKLLRATLKKLGISENGEYLGKIKQGPFWWVKEWGFGQSAYLFDFLDPVFRPQILKDFTSIYLAFKAFPIKDNQFPDPFDIVSVRKDLDPVSRERLRKQQIEMQLKLDQRVFSASVNAVQVHQGLKSLNWNYDKSRSDYAKTFVLKYDMNKDGRLSPRELLLGSIHFNQAIFLTDQCKLCYEEILDQIDAVFAYLDCDKDGHISAEDLYTHLPKLRRDSQQHNFFLLSNIATIRTAVVNDFLLKNSYSTRGLLTKKEFRHGILLGFWDRQTSDTNIVNDDSRNLKSLRWSEDEVVDTLAMKYAKHTLLARAKEYAALKDKQEDID